MADQARYTVEIHLESGHIERDTALYPVSWPPKRVKEHLLKAYPKAACVRVRSVRSHRQQWTHPKRREDVQG